MKNNLKGITLIALVITVIVILILVGVGVNSLVGKNGLITRTKEAKFLTQLSQIKEEIDVYKTGKYLEQKTGLEAYPIKLNEAGIGISLREMLSEEERNNLDLDLKYELLNMSSSATSTEIPNIDNIDYGVFYQLDSELISSSRNYSGRLVIYVKGDQYKVIDIDGVYYKGEKFYTVIPLKGLVDPQYYTIGNNTYKLYGDGTLKMLGQLSINSGITIEEQAEIYGLKELDLNRINEENGNKMALPAKKILFNDAINKSSFGTIYVIDQNNDLWAWGANGYNKLGQGNSYLIVEPTKILENRTGEVKNIKVKDVWAGATNTWVVDTENRVWACGTNETGELGQGNMQYYDGYIQIKQLDGSLIEKIEMSKNEKYGSTIVKYTDGRVFGTGYNSYGGLGIGNTNHQTSFIELSSYDSKFLNAKDIINQGIYCYVLTQSGDLYGTGYNAEGALGLGDTISRKELTFIKSNIKDIHYYYRLGCIDKEGNCYYMINNLLTVISNIQDINAKFSAGGILISNRKMYLISVSNAKAIPYLSNYESDVVRKDYLRVFESNGKLYLPEYPDITLPKKSSNYTLRNIFENAIFVQGTGSNINIVSREGDIYETPKVKNEQLSNIKKLIASERSKFALSSTGEIYAKGEDITGVWGEVASKDSYVKVTRDGTNAFENVKEIYTSKYGGNLIFQTQDNKLYWAGATSVSQIPNKEGDLNKVGYGKVTKYPKEIKASNFDLIKDQIKDIKCEYINAGGVKGGTTFVLTTTGDLYACSDNSNMTGLNRSNSDIEKLVIKESQIVQQIDTADGLTLAVLSNGEVYGWGYNTNGILGEGYSIGEIYPTPVKLNLPSNVSYLSIGDGFAIFATKTGEVYGIGRNDYGQLGTGNNQGTAKFIRCPELEK